MDGSCTGDASPSGDLQLQEGPEPGFDSLPVELRLKCLANCDWQSLSRAACASRSSRALVSEAQRVRIASLADDRIGDGSTAALPLAAAHGLLVRLPSFFAFPGPPLQVSYLVRSPYWRTHVEEQPAVLTTDFERAEDRQHACDQWAVRGPAPDLRPSVPPAALLGACPHTSCIRDAAPC